MHKKFFKNRIEAKINWSSISPKHSLETIKKDFYIEINVDIKRKIENSNCQNNESLVSLSKYPFQSIIKIFFPIIIKCKNIFNLN